MAEIDYQSVAISIKEAINDSPKKSRRVLLKTLLKMYGHKTRQKHWIDSIQVSLNDAGITTNLDITEAERDEWIILSVTNPHVPVGDFIPQQTYGPNGEGYTPVKDPWLNEICNKNFNSEKEVEIRFVLPMLELLGYQEDDRADGYPVEQIIGVKKSKTEADFVLFDGLNRSKDSALLVVEAKKVGKNINDHIGQARSYAMFLGTPYYMITNGDEIRAFLYRSPIESDVEVFKSCRRDLASTFAILYNIISKLAVVEYKKRRAAPLP